MSDALVVEQPAVLDLLDQQSPPLSSTNDMPVVETKPDSVAAEPAKVEAEPEAQAEQPGESATPATEEESGQQAGEEKPRGVGKALAELRQQLREEREGRERERQASEQLAKALAALERASGNPEEPPAPAPQRDDSEPVRPSRHDFSDPDAYDAAMDFHTEAKAAWTARREIEKARFEAMREAQARVIEEQQRTIDEAYALRVSKAVERYPDFDEVARRPDVTVSRPMAEEIKQNEHGVDIQHYLGSHPEEAARISNMTLTLFNPNTRQMEIVPNILEQVYALRKIGDKLANQTPPAATKPPVSAAPRPIKPIAAGSDTVSKSLEDMSMEEYAAKRKADWGRGARH
jgi:hypothetical protein